MLNFEEFQKSREEWTVERAELLFGELGELEGAPAGAIVHVYAGGVCYLSEPRPGAFHLVLERSEYESSDRTALERILYSDFYAWQFAPEERTTAALSSVLEQYCTWQMLPHACALEISMFARLSPIQRAWFESFLEAWEAAEENEAGA